MAAKTEKQRRADRAASRRRRRKKDRLTFLVLLVLAVVLILLLSHSCKKNDPAAQVTSAPTTTTAVKTTVKTTAPTNAPTNAFEVTEEDGLTYIDGVLIVNKTYALPADYYPGGLTQECADAFESMQNAAAAEGLTLKESSGFRSYEQQRQLYENYLAQDPNADTYSARPGHSEHQSGLAIDLNDVSDAFGDTPEGKWVNAHCAEYGFIIRYPKEKEAQTGYMYEPWHIRYVGVEMAKKITDSGLCLEEYFGITSEYEE